MGHVPLLVCLGNDAGDADFEVVVASREEQSSVYFWRNLRIDVAIVWNWLHGSELLAVIRQADIKIIVRADTDGNFSQRVFPIGSFTRMIGNGKSLRNRVGLARYFFQRRLSAAYIEDQEAIATMDASDSVIVETDTAKQNVSRFLCKYNRSDLTRKLKTVSHSVSETVLRNASRFNISRKPLIFCGGRWDSPQKDVNLLCKTLYLILRSRPDCHVVVSGPIPEADRSAIESISCNIECTGAVDRTFVIDCLLKSRFLLSSSRWETQPIGALEALCLGATVVAPPLPSFLDMLESGRFGTLSRRRTARSLARASIAELEQWDKGLRDGTAISKFWSSHVSNEKVISGVLGDFVEPVRA